MCISMPWLAWNAYVNDEDILLAPLIINTIGLILWLNNCASILLYGTLLCYMTLYYINYKFTEIHEMTMSNNLSWKRLTGQFHR